MRSTYFSTIRQHQKDLAQMIKDFRSDRMTFEDQCKAITDFQEKYGTKLSFNLSREFRHYHIAYCEIRGRTRDQIEHPGENHKANEDRINSIKNMWMGKINEALCDHAA